MYECVDIVVLCRGFLAELSILRRVRGTWMFTVAGEVVELFVGLWC